MRKTFCILILALACLGLAGCGVQAASLEGAPQPVTIAAPTQPPELKLASDQGRPALMETEDGAFFPNGTVSRGELCVRLAPLVAGLPAGSRSFSDWRGDEIYEAASRLSAAGILPWDGARSLNPEEEVTRAELADILLRLSERLSGEERALARSISEDAASGRTAFPEASGAAEEPISRGELAVVLERLMEREPDEAGLLIGGLLPEDIGPEDYAWAYIADAAHDGAVPQAEPGVHRAYGWLYAVWDDGTLVTDMDYGVWSFGLDGRYTCGSEMLDDYLQEALELCGANEMSDEEALEAVYLYVKYNYEYLIRPEDMEELEVGAFGWEYERALRFFRYGGGPCYGYAAAFGLLARALGANAYIVSGEVNQYHGAHSFVVIPTEDGTDLIYDVELEATRQERHEDLALFGIENYTIYNYWYETDWAAPA